MKSIYISIILFISMLCGILFSINYINNASHDLSVLCENIEGYIYLDKWQDAYDSSVDVLDKWDDYSDTMSLYYHSAELDSLNNEIVKLTQYTKTREKEHALSSVHLVKYLIKQFEDTQKIKLHNIL